MASERRKAKRKAEQEAARKASAGMPPLASSSAIKTKTNDTKKDVNTGQGKDSQKPKTPIGLRTTIGAIIGGSALVVWILSVATNGFFNFFSDRPAVQLFPVALAICICVLFLLHRMGGVKSNRLLFCIGVILCIGVLAVTSILVCRKNLAIQQADKERKDEMENLPEKVVAALNKSGPSNPKTPKWQPEELPPDTHAINIIAKSLTGAFTIKTDGSENELLGGFLNLDSKGYPHGEIHPYIGYVLSNRFYLKARIPAPAPWYDFTVNGFNIEGHIPPTWQMNHDDNSFEIIDMFDHPIYQITYRRSDTIEIAGEFRLGKVGGPVWCITTNGPRYGEDTIEPKELGLKKIFIYPETVNPGKRVEQ